jgi:hypothetical protein
MIFFNREGQKITIEEWVDIYESYYFLGGEIFGRRITRNNQGSEYVEGKIEEILERGLVKEGLREDLTLIVAWKIGAIDHNSSVLLGGVIYKNEFNLKLKFSGQYGVIYANDIINYCLDNFDKLIELCNDPQQLYDDLYKNRGQGNGIGATYCISLLYFFTQGKWPIYDKFAHTAINAIINDVHPSEVVNYRAINDFPDYCNNYVEKIKDIFGEQKIPRKIDRALWVYGHFF